MAAASFFGWGRRRRGLGHTDRSPQLPALAATRHRPAQQPRGRNLAPGLCRCRHPEGTVLARLPRGCRCRVLFGVAGAGRWEGGSDAWGEPSVVMAGSPALPGLQDPAPCRAPRGCGRTDTGGSAGPAIAAATEHRRNEPTIYCLCVIPAWDYGSPACSCRGRRWVSGQPGIPETWAGNRWQEGAGT